MSGDVGGPGAARGPLRLLLVAERPLLADLIRAGLDTEPGMAVVGPTIDPAGVEPAVHDHRPDVVVYAVDSSDDEVAERPELFCARPPSDVLAVFGNGRLASLWELTPQRRALGEFSVELLVGTLRRQAERRHG